MASFNKLKKDQILYSVQRRKMGNTTITEDAVFAARVEEIDLEGRRAKISINGNPSRWYSERNLKKLKVNKPDPSKLKRPGRFL